MNLIETVKLNNRQKAIGVILLFPWYLYFAPTILNFLINPDEITEISDFFIKSIEEIEKKLAQTPDFKVEKY